MLTIYHKDRASKGEAVKPKFQLPGKQLLSQIYSYDLKENDYYKSIMQVEIAINESRKNDKLRAAAAANAQPPPSSKPQ